MKSPARRKEIDTLLLQWDHKALLPSNLKKSTHPDSDEQRLLDEYFNFLDDIKPHMQELRNTKLFNKPFNLF